MDNSLATTPHSPLKGDAYRAYEQLPAAVRRALQEGLVDWCPLRAREWHEHLLRRQRLRPAQATHLLVQAIRRHDHAEVAAFARTWPKGAAAYPHVAAGASLQRYAGTEGIPPAEPLPVAPPARRPEAAAPIVRRAKPQAGPKATRKRPKARVRRKAGRRARR
jgi:hypothetical protein